MNWFVCRHFGTIAWAKENQLAIDYWVNHLHIDDIQAGDVVYGILPVHLIYAINQKGARYYHLEIHLQAEQRGQELSKASLQKMQVQLVPYEVIKKDK